jgi:hypothetical protein
MTPLRTLVALSLVACHRPAPPPAGRAPAPASPIDAAPRDASLSDAAPITALVCPAGTLLRASTWSYQSGKVPAPLQWCELPDGTKQGPWRKTLANGQPVETAEYDHDKLSGQWSSYFFPDNGHLSEQGTYVAGVKHGTWRKWWGTGALEEVLELDHGTPVSSESFYPNGHVAERGRYAAGVLDGEWSSFAQDGSPTKLVVYAHGKPVRAWRWKDGKRVPLPLSELDAEP